MPGMPYFKDSKALQKVRLKPRRLIKTAAVSENAAGIASTYNRIGGLLQAFEREAGVPVPSALAVWSVESGRLPFVRGKPVLRFEVHKFWQHWGQFHRDQFNQHFRFGGHEGEEGRAWQGHKFREREHSEWSSFHGSQLAEAQVFQFAARLGGLEAAAQSASFGGPQILGSNHLKIGYDSAVSMYRAFAASERWQVCGFFDFCAAEQAIDAIRRQDWVAFARIYNGPGQAEAYGKLIAEAEQAAQAVLRCE